MSQPTTAVIPAQRPSLIQTMAAQYQIDPTKFLATLKATILPKATDEEMQAFCIVANAYALNPFLKEIHAFPNKSGGITPVVGVDGWCSLMNRRPEFDGIEFESEDVDGKPHAVTASIHIKGRSRPVKVTEYYAECHRNTDPWAKSPRRMLRHKALIQAARVAFGFSGIHDEDEAMTVANVTEVKTVERPIFTKTTKETVKAVQDAKAAEVAPVVEVAPTVAEATKAPPVDTAGVGPMSPQDQLANIVTGAGYTFDQFIAWASANYKTGNAVDFDSIGVALASRLVAAKADVLAALAEGGGK